MANRDALILRVVFDYYVEKTCEIVRRYYLLTVGHAKFLQTLSNLMLYKKSKVKQNIMVE